MSSFYGGRRGASFEIVKRYLTYEEMIADIKNIDYNSYVVVEEGNNIYRKTSTGYVFIMSVDPSKISTSLASSLNMGNYSTIELLKDKTSYSIGEAEINDSTQNTIKYNSVIDDTGKTLIGFSFPSYSFDFQLKANANETKIERIDDKTNPFLEIWELSIANLVGRSFSNLRIVNSNEITQTVYSSLDYTTPVSLPKNTQVILYDIQEEDIKTIYFGVFDTINNITLSEEGALTINTLNTTLSYQFKDIKDVTFENGELNFLFKDETSKKFNLNYPKEIKIDESYSLFTTYANGTEVKISEPINYILDTKIENNHLFIKFSDSTYKQEEQVNGYVDFGSVKSNSGILIGRNYLFSDVPSPFSINTTIEFLNTQYPTGLTGDNLEGKIVTIGNDNENKYLFAFDYSKNSWYFLSSIAQTTAFSLVGAYTVENLAIADALPNGGLWFIEEM